MRRVRGRREMGRGYDESDERTRFLLGGDEDESGYM